MSEGAIYAILKQVRTITAPVAQVSQLVLSYDHCRKSLVIYNDAPCATFLTFGPVASLVNATAIIRPYGHWELWGPAIWCGEVSAIREADSGPLVISVMY